MYISSLSPQYRLYLVLSETAVCDVKKIGTLGVNNRQLRTSYSQSTLTKWRNTTRSVTADTPRIDVWLYYTPTPTGGWFPGHASLYNRQAR